MLRHRIIFSSLLGSMIRLPIRRCMTGVW